MIFGNILNTSNFQSKVPERWKLLFSQIAWNTLYLEIQLSRVQVIAGFISPVSTTVNLGWGVTYLTIPLVIIYLYDINMISY